MVICDGGNDVITVDNTTVGGETFKDISSIQIHTGGGTNVVNIEATTVPVSVNAQSGGNNTVNITPSAENLSNLGATVNISGSGATLNVFDGSPSSGLTYAVTNSSLTRTGAGTVNYSGVSNLIFHGGVALESFCNTFNIESTAYGCTTTIYGGSGWDTYNLCPDYKALDAIQGQLYLYSSGGTNTINFFDQNETANVTNALTSGAVARTGSAGVVYSNIQAVNINGGSGNVNYSLVSHASGVSTTINAGDGNDMFGVLGTPGDLSLVQGTLTFNGGGGTQDRLIFGGFSDNDETYTLTGSTVTRTGTGVIHYSGTEMLVLEDGCSDGTTTFNVNGTASGTSVLIQVEDGDETFNINSIAAGSTLTITVGDTGNSTFNIAPNSQNLANVQGTVNISSQGGTLHLFNQGNLDNDVTHTFTSNQVRAFDGTSNPTVINFMGVDSVVFDGGGGADEDTYYDILSTASGISLSIQAGASDDTFTLGSSHRLDAILGAVFVDGGGGNNQIVLDDAARSDTYTIMQGRTTVSELSFNFTYNGGSIDSLVLLTSSQSTVDIDDGLSFEVMVNP